MSTLDNILNPVAAVNGVVLPWRRVFCFVGVGARVVDRGPELNRVDIVLNGWGEPVQCATTGNTDLGLTFTAIDGHGLENNDRVMVWQQTLGAQNGIYVWSSLTEKLTRAADFDQSEDIFTGASFWCTDGTSYGDNLFVLETKQPIVLGTTELVFGRVASGTSGGGDPLVTAGVNGIVLKFPGGAKAVFTSDGSTAGGAWVSAPTNSVIARQAGNVVALTPGANEQALMYRSNILQFASVYDLPNNQDLRWRNGANSAYLTAFDVEADDILRIGSTAIRVSLPTSALGFFGKTPTATSAPAVVGDDAPTALGSLLTALDSTLGLVSNQTTGLGLESSAALPTECVLQFNWETPSESCTLVHASVPAFPGVWDALHVTIDGSPGDSEVGLVCDTDNLEHYIECLIDDWEPGLGEFEVCVRPGVYNWIALAGVAGQWIAWFNITTGALGTLTDPNSHVISTRSIADLGGGVKQCLLRLNTYDTAIRIYPCAGDGILTAPAFASAACFIQSVGPNGPGLRVGQTRVMRAENRHPWLRNTYAYRALLTDPASNTNEEQPVVFSAPLWGTGGLSFAGYWTPTPGVYARYLEIQDMAGGYDLIRQLSGTNTPFALYCVLARRDSSGTGKRRIFYAQDLTGGYYHEIYFDQATGLLINRRSQPNGVFSLTYTTAPPGNTKALVYACYNGGELFVGVGGEVEEPVAINPTARIEFSEFSVGGNPAGTTAATQSECTIWGLYLLMLPPGAARSLIDPGGALDLAVRAAIAARHNVTTTS